MSSVILAKIIFTFSLEKFVVPFFSWSLYIETKIQYIVSNVFFFISLYIFIYLPKSRHTIHFKFGKVSIGPRLPYIFETGRVLYTNIFAVHLLAHSADKVVRYEFYIIYFACVVYILGDALLFCWWWWRWWWRCVCVCVLCAIVHAIYAKWSFETRVVFIKPPFLYAK